MTRCEQLLPFVGESLSLVKMMQLCSHLQSHLAESPLSRLTAGVETLSVLADSWNSVQAKGELESFFYSNTKNGQTCSSHSSSPLSLHNGLQLLLALCQRWRVIDANSWKSRVRRIEAAECHGGKAILFLQLDDRVFDVDALVQ